MAKKKLLAFAALAGAPFTSHALAATTTWTNTSGDYTWDNSTNWDTGVPTSTATAVFDAAGAGTITNGASDTAAEIQFGNGETSPPSIAPFTLSGGTISIPVSGATTLAAAPTIISYTGTTNTTTQTISSNLVLGNTADTGTLYYIVNDTSSGNLTLSGNISDASTNATLPSPILVFNVNPGDTVTLSGSSSLVDPATSYGPVEVGSSNTGTYGNVVITNAAWLPATARAGVYGTTGALQYATGSGTGITATQQSYINLYGARTSESAPQIENVSGTNTIASGGIELRTPGNAYIQSDTGLLSIVYIQAYSLGASTAYLDGAGNGIITGNINNKGATTSSVVKDGSGTWTYGSTIGTIAAGIGTTVAGGTLLVDTTSNGTTTGILGPVTVNNTGTGSAVLGGSGSIVGAVGVTGGGKINPGDVGVGAANVGTLTLLGGVTASGASVSSGAFFQFDLDSDADSADKISTTNLTLGSGISTLSLDDLGSTPLTTGTTFNLVAYTGTLSGTFQNYANNSDITVGNNTYVLNYGTGTNSDISLTSVPEPTTWLYSVVGLAALLGVQRRRGPVRA